MAKINKLFGPGEYIVLKDIVISGLTEIRLIQDSFSDRLETLYRGILPRHIENIIPAKSIVTIIRQEKNFINGHFVSIIDLTCSDDSCYTYTCVIEGNTYDVLKELDGAGKVLYGKG